jgi:peptidoglycan/xylan/chitin deacetylase (PgdA/CDA1 family)
MQLKINRRAVATYLLALMVFPLTEGIAPVANAQVAPAASTAKVSITFDDWYLSTYNIGLQTLKAYNLPATLFVSSGYVGQSGNLNWAQIKELQDTHKWDIGGHTVTHAELPTLSASKILTEVSQNKADLVNHGINAVSFATPYGAYDNTSLATIARYFDSHRGFWDRDDLNTWPYNKETLMVQAIQRNTTPNTVKSWVNQAKTQKKWLILVFHDLKPTVRSGDTYSYSSANFNTVVKNIAESGVKNVTIREGLAMPGWQNVITNSSFENGITDGWNADSANIKLNTQNNGNYPSPTNSIQFNGATVAQHLYSPRFNIVAGANYLINTFVNTAKLTSGELGVFIDEYDVNGNWISGKWIGSAANVNVFQFAKVYTPTSGSVASAVVQYYLTANAQGFAYIDSAEVLTNAAGGPVVTPTPTNTPTPSPTPSVTPTTTPTPTGTPSPTPTGTPTVTPTPTATPTPVPVVNLVPNPSFEQVTSGWVNNWQRDQVVYTVNSLSQGNAGINSILLGNTTRSSHLFSDRIPVDATKTYTWQTYIKAPSLNGEFGFYIDEYDAAGNWISGQWKGMVTAGFTGTNSIGYTPTSTNVKTAGLQYYATTGSYQIYLDSVNLHAN